MSVHFISGKPGGGKTLYAVRLILAELRHGRRKIVTNVSLKLGALNEYLQKEGIDLGSEHITERITVIGEDQLRDFFLYRGGGVVLAATEDKVDYSAAGSGGVLYVLDEIHIAFNSRAWAETGRRVIYYLSQHRKLGDDVVLITQAVMNVDKQFRSMAQDYTYIRNLKKERAGLFGLPGIFLRRTFLEPATDTSRATESGTFTLDVSGIASCYDTAAGVGIIGRAGADTREKQKGLPWWIFVVGVVGIILGLVHFLPQTVEWLVSGGRKGPIAVASARPPASSPAPAARSPAVLSPVRAASSPVGTNVLYCRGVAFVGGDLTAFLSDGRTLRMKRGEISEYRPPDYVVVDGERLWIRP